MLVDPLRSDPSSRRASSSASQRPFISALITLDDESLPVWLERHQLPAGTTMAAGRPSTPKILAEIQELVEPSANQTVSRAEAIKVFRIVPTDLTEATAHLTLSLKFKRAQVLKDYADVVESIYTQKNTPPAATGQAKWRPRHVRPRTDNRVRMPSAVADKPILRIIRCL